MSFSIFNRAPLEQVDCGDEIVCLSTGRRAVSGDLIPGKNLIFVHGFLSHGDHFVGMANYFQASGFNCFVFSYDYSRSFFSSAQSLYEKIDDLVSLSGHDNSSFCFSLICHSFGGLVGRAFFCGTDAEAYCKEIVTLGTPHAGVLSSQLVVRALIKISELLNDNTIVELSSGRAESLRQLTLEDHRSGSKCAITRLNDMNISNGVRHLSISGGLGDLRLPSKLIVKVLEHRLKALLGNQVNDGIVLESSSDLRRSCCRISSEHLNDYAEYQSVNHFSLVDCQALNLKIIRWLNEN